MAKRLFTKEEMELLQTNRYVITVRPSMIHFTIEFKKMFWDMMLSGKTPIEAVTELGLDPNILGEKRIYGLKSMIGNEARTGKGFKDLARNKAYNKVQADPEIRIRYLEQQLAYKDQELEFLKKIVSLSDGETVS